jgi:putative transcriptional regulator
VGATRTALTLTLILTAVALRTRGDAIRKPPQLVPGAVRALAPGKLLVASRDLPDGNFSETVILLVNFNSEGAMGLVINRRTEVPLAEAFPKMKKISAEARIYAGGPVAATSMIGLLRTANSSSDLRHVVGDVYVVSERQPLERLIGEGADPKRFHVYFGYAGWGPGQLEMETLHGAWHVVQGDSALVFDPDPASLWRREIRRTDGLMALIISRSPGPIS